MPSAPADPPFSFTFNHASHTNCLGITYDFPFSLDSNMRFLPCGWAHTQARTTPPLGSTPAAIRAGFTATTGESAGTPGDGTLLLTVSAAWSPSYRRWSPSSGFQVHLHTFHR